MSNNKYYVYAFVAALITAGSGYFFIHAKPGIHFENISLLIICVIALISFFIFLSKAKGNSFKPLARALGLEIASAMSLGTGGHVDMEGKIQNRTVFLRYEESSGKYRHHCIYKFALQLNNPHNIDLYIGPEGLLNTPANAMFLPKKLDTGDWEWAEFITVYGAPAETINSIFSNKDNTETFSAFFSKFNIRAKNDKMEFEVNEKNLDDIIPDLKEILNYAISVANALDNG